MSYAPHNYSKKREEDKGCRRKKTFYTSKAAYKSAHMISKHGVVMRVYKCPFCKHYHLTSKPNYREIKYERTNTRRTEKNC